MKKENRIITLKERVIKDQFYEIPLLVVILYLIFYPISYKYSFDMAISREYLSANSVAIFFTTMLYAFLVNDTQRQVLNVYKKSLTDAKENNKMILIFKYSYLLTYHSIFCTMIYFFIAFRYVLFLNPIVKPIDVLSIIGGFYCHFFGRGAYKETQKFVSNNKQYFTWS